MGRALSEDLRARKACRRGQRWAGFGVGISSAIRWIARVKIGDMTPRPQRRGRASNLDAHEVFIAG